MNYYKLKIEKHYGQVYDYMKNLSFKGQGLVRELKTILIGVKTTLRKSPKRPGNSSLFVTTTLQTMFYQNYIEH